MATPTPSVKQVAPLTENQIAQFKRDGFLVLPGVLDPELCRQARNEMWETIAAHLPRMKRDDPSTWTPLTEEESTKLSTQQPAIGGEPYFNGKGHRFYIRNGTEPLILDLAPRALWQIAEQLLGEGILSIVDAAQQELLTAFMPTRRLLLHQNQFPHLYPSFFSP